MIYDKSRILFGLDKAKMSIRNSKFALVVEGQMDVITAHQHGFKNVVASSGTALTETQLQMLKRYTGNIALAFDMDEAGKSAADRGIQEALKQDMNVKVVQLPGSKDPDELIRENPKEFKSAIENALHIMDYYFQVMLEDLDLGTVEGKREAAKRMLPIIAKIKNKIEKDEWIRRLSETINTDERYLREALPREGGGRKQQEEQEEGPPSGFPQKTRGEVMSEMLLALMVRYPSFLDLVVDRMDVDEIFGYENKMFYKNIIIYYNNANSVNTSEELNFSEFRSYLDNSSEEGSAQLNLLDKLGILGEKEFSGMEKDQAKKELLRVIQELKRLYITERKKEIEQLIARSEKEGDKEKVEELMKELKNLSEESGTSE